MLSCRLVFARGLLMRGAIGTANRKTRPLSTFTHTGAEMNDKKKCLMLLVAAVASVTLAQAATAPAQSGTVVSEQSVNCGSKGGSKKNLELLCQEYVVHASSTNYHIRQQKPGSQALVPVNTNVEFSINKDKMKFKIDGKSYEYVVVSETAVAGQS